MLEKISQRVYRWVEMHGEARGTPYTWNSYVINCSEAGVLALVDPLPMTTEEASELETIGKPTHILLTCEYHVREAEMYREKYGCQILANQMEQHWYEITLDGYFEDGQCLWDKVDLAYIPNVKFQETAFLVRENGGTLIVGDLLAGGRQDQGIRDEEVELCGAYNVADLGKARKSLWKLLDFEFGTLCFAHGTPVRQKPKEKLRSYLESEKIWQRLQEGKETISLTEEQWTGIKNRWKLNRTSFGLE